MHQLIQYTLGIKEVRETRGNVAAVPLAWHSVHGLPRCTQPRLVPYMPWKSIKVRRGGLVFPCQYPMLHMPFSWLEIPAMVQLHDNVR